MPFFQVDENTHLYFIDEPPLPSQQKKSVCLLIHGWTCDITDWVFLIPQLTARGHRVIAYDHRGHGKSTVPSVAQPEQLRIEVIADDGTALLKHLIREEPMVKAIVFGHSSGGLAASVLATRHPQVVEALVLIDPAYHRERKQLLGFLPKLASPEQGGASVLVPIFDKYSSLPWMQVWHRSRLLAMPHHIVYEHARQKAEQTDAIGSWERCKSDFGSSNIGGKGLRSMSRLVIFKDEENVNKEKELGLEEGSEVVVLSEGGHWPHQQCIEKFWELLSAWLDKINQ